MAGRKPVQPAVSGCPQLYIASYGKFQAVSPDPRIAAQYVRDQFNSWRREQESLHPRLNPPITESAVKVVDLRKDYVWVEK